jgi:EAL domain-containing protein (putative c-di-GMP-specific phosphodiesterase class I)
LFAVVLLDIQQETEVAHRVQDLQRACFGEPFRAHATSLRVSAKVGAAIYPNDGNNGETMFRNTEAALKRAKATGENLVFYAQEMTERVAERLSMETKLREALERDEFQLRYQPKVDLDQRRVQSVEALMRWNSPNMGLVLPNRFIPLLEETGLILDVGAWALRRAVLDHRHWVQKKALAPRIAVNVSAIQLRQHNFVDIVREAIRAGANPPGIDVEITESLLMEDLPGNIKKLKILRDLGLEIAIDDFGTGYSSLGYLAKLPIQTLKIDRSFITTMVDEADTRTVVSTIISLAHSLRLKVVAEGVETEEQAKMLRALRCDQIQGFLISRPMAFEDMTQYLSPGSS